MSLRGSHASLDPGMLPVLRTIELPPTTGATGIDSSTDRSANDGPTPDFSQSWIPHGSLPRVIDIFQDGSVLIVDAPGHLPGHINILARTGPGKYTYLAGDSCHDRRIMRREREIGEWHDENGHICCIHTDKEQAEKTIELILQLESEGVEIILAHDVEWEEKSENQARFFGAS